MSQFDNLDLKGFNQKYLNLEHAKYDQFQNNNGFMSLQRNGQRIYGGPPDGWQGPPPSRGCEVYVTRIPRDCFENELVPIFTKVGPVYEHRLMMEHTGVNRGYGYVRFTNIQDAKEAIKQLNNFEIRPGRYLVVTKSVDNRRLWVNGIPKNRSAKEIRGEMERLTSGVNDIILYPSQADKSKSRGYMFVEYESHRAAALARKKLVQGSMFLFGQEIGQVDWAEPEHEVDEETMSTVKILFVRNLMLSTTENTIRDLFNRMGNNSVERVKKAKDYAFVHFSTREAAEKALKASNPLTIDDAEVEVVWSKPVDKQTYNTRKTLTKVFTSGMSSDLVTREGAMVRGISPRRRGAAGIRGLGAPGTAPPKQLVQRYAAMTAASSVTHGARGGIPLPHTVTTYRPATDLLLDICQNNNWGEPVYSLISSNQGEDEEANTEKMFIYKVTIPNFPLPPPNNVFQSMNWKPSHEDAKLEAAQLVLTCLRISPEYVAAVIPSMAPSPSLYPLNPAHLQGIPLTAGWPGGFAYPPTSMYGRIAYSPYDTAYASMLSSMYGMSIA